MFWRDRGAEEAAKRQQIIGHNNSNFNRGEIAVLFTGASTLLACVFCRRAVAARRFVPEQFNANIFPPKFSPVKDAAKAVFDATLLATSLFGFAVSSAFWMLNVGSLTELGSVLTTQFSPPRDESKVDPESKRVETAINNWLSK